MVFLLCFLALLLSPPFSLRIIESSTGQPLADCHVQVDGKTVGVTDSIGVWIVPDTYRSSTVSISHIGHNTRTINLMQFKQGAMTVSLDAAAYGIEEVVVSSKHRVKYINMGITGKKQNDYLGRKGVYIYDERPIGIYIPNTEHDKNLEIQQVKIYIPEEATAPAAPFWMSIYAGERDYIAPKERNKIYGPLLTQASERGQYHTINLQHEHMQMPQGGLFIALQNNPTNDEGAFTKTYPYNHKKSKNLPKSKTGVPISHDILVGDNTITFTSKANCTSVGESWQYCNHFYNWVGRIDESGSTLGFDGNAIRWVRDTLYMENFPKHHAVQSTNYMIYVVLKEIKE